ncbi:VTT domain-containing protein [Labilibacter marinus]|uniref:VTT domain-containing protein n=1 Tax=Labilibacter marinus TaxID=1477105 RepID=UPI00094FFC57|nr:VTT domain-containing protein [Labilibacter marinus]
MEELIKYISVYLAGAAGIWKGIPVGIALGLAPFYTATLTSLGAISSTLIIYFSGESFRNWLLSKYGKESKSNKRKKISSWLEKYGVAGLGLVATGLFGSFITLMIGILLIDNTRKFIIYLLIGIVIWSYGITYLSDPVIAYIKGLF